MTKLYLISCVLWETFILLGENLPGILLITLVTISTQLWLLFRNRQMIVKSFIIYDETEFCNKLQNRWNLLFHRQCYLVLFFVAKSAMCRKQKHKQAVVALCLFVSDVSNNGRTALIGSSAHSRANFVATIYVMRAYTQSRYATPYCYGGLNTYSFRSRLFFMLFLLSACCAFTITRLQVIVATLDACRHVCSYYFCRE